MLGLRQLKDTDGSGKGNRNVVGNFPGGGGCKGVIFLLTFSFSSPLQIIISSMIYLVFFWFIAVVAARGSYVGHFKPCIFIHEFERTLHIQNYVV